MSDDLKLAPVVTDERQGKCHTASCNEAPAVRVFWPNQTCDMCPECALRAQGVARAMGFELSVAVIAPVI